jgi:hypothetical protein
MGSTLRRVSYVFLCTGPLLAFILVSLRALRIPGVYQATGGVLFAAILIAAWTVGARSVIGGAEAEQRVALSGGLLITPFALGLLLWVGLGPPWLATPAENVMRYVVLLVSSVAVAGGFIVLKEALSEAGERSYSTLGLAAALLAGCTYLVWMCFALGASIGRVRDGQMPSAIVSLNGVLDILLYVACFLTYVATAAFAVACGRSGWLGRNAARAYVVASAIALMFLMARGISYPDPKALSTPWYTQPGFIVGIPAVPFIMPHLLGVVLLRRAGDRKV